MTMDALNTAYMNIQENLPATTKTSAIRSFVYSGLAITLLSSGNILLGASIGAFAATVSLVDSIATAAIKKMFPGKDHFEWYENYTKLFGAVTVVNLLAFPFLGTFAINVFAVGVFTFIFDLFSGKLGQPTSINSSNMLFII